LVVAATDAAGNTDPTPAIYTWSVVEPPPAPDTTAPETTITSAPEAQTTETSARFSFVASEPASSFACSLDGGEFVSCTSPVSYDGLSMGERRLAVAATDAAGNTDPTPAIYTWSVVEPPPAPDTTAPETTITSAPEAQTTETSARFSFVASEPGSTFACSLDDASFAACASPVEYAGLGVGEHTLVVAATDAAGNTDPTPAEHRWIVAVPPACTAPGTVTLGAAADSWVLQSSPTSNYGNDSVAKIDTKADANARALFRFELPAVPAGCRVVDARLRLYASSWKPGRTMEVTRADTAWNEATVTWANQPASAGTAAPALSGEGWREWNVVPHVMAMYTAGNFGFIVRDQLENGNGIEQQYHSREKAPDNTPLLVVTFAAE
jgi:hypothetical protein